MNTQFDEVTKGMPKYATRWRALKKFSVSLASLTLGSFAFANPAYAGTPSYTTIDYPGAVFTDCVGINRVGDIVGHYVDAASVDHGYLLRRGTYTTIDFPGSNGGHVHDINSSGAIVGLYILAKRYNGFVLSGGVYASIEYPGAQSTRANGVNTAGDIVGSYYENNSDSTGGSNGSKGHGFLLSGGVYRAIDFPGADYTDAWRINDNGQIVGRYKSGNGDFHVFLLTIASGTFTSIDYPGATQTAMGDFTQMGGLNNNGDIASDFCSSSSNCEVASFGSLHGFVLSAGIFNLLDVPGAAGTAPFGINDRGVVVVGYTDANLRVHGFLRTP